MNSDKENILIIAYNDLNNSGVPNVIYQIVKALHNKYNFDIMIFGNNLYYYEKLKHEGVFNVSLIKSSLKKPKNKIKKALFYLFENNRKYYLETSNVLKNKKYVAIHSFKEYDSGPFLKAAKNANISKRIIHTTVVHDKPRSIVERRRRRLSLKYGNIFVGVTEPACKSAFPKKHFKVIHFSYDDLKFNMNVGSKLKDEQLFLTQVGTYSSNKNQLFSIEIMRHLKTMCPNARLRIIGRENEFGYQKRMEEAINNYHLKKEVELIDGTNGIGDSLEYTSFSLLTSLKEGASLVAIESQACGITVFASNAVFMEMNVGGIQYLDLKDEPRHWAETINSYFAKYGNNRKKYDLSSFSKQHFFESISSLYK